MKKRICWLVVLILLSFVIALCIHKINVAREKIVEDIGKTIIEDKNTENEHLNSELGLVEVEEEIEEVEKVEEPVEVIEESTYQYEYITRMTSFWANDGYGTGECTGSGLCSWNFQTNDKGWYTYNGKLVIATATIYLANQGWYLAEGVHTYRYYDELILNIDGVDYDAIVLDSCGSSMKTDRVDLFVSNGYSAKDTNIVVKVK